MSIHPLVLCSQILYDKQLSDDAKQLKALNDELNKWKTRCIFIHYAHSLFAQPRPDGFLQMLCNCLVGRTGPETNALAHLTTEFDVKYSVQDKLCDYNPPDDFFPRQTTNNKLYYSDEDVHLVFCIKENTISFGRKFWKTSRVRDQHLVYVFLSVLHQLYDIPSDDFSEGTYFYVLNSALDQWGGIYGDLSVTEPRQQEHTL